MPLLLQLEIQPYDIILGPLEGQRVIQQNLSYFIKVKKNNNTTISQQSKQHDKL